MFMNVQLGVRLIVSSVWQGMEVYDCSAEFRQFWLRQRLDECDHVHSSNARNKFAIRVRGFA